MEIFLFGIIIISLYFLIFSNDLFFTNKSKFFGISILCTLILICIFGVVKIQYQELKETSFIVITNQIKINSFNTINFKVPKEIVVKCYNKKWSLEPEECIHFVSDMDLKSIKE